MGTAPLSRCAAILDLREAFTLHLKSAKVKKEATAGPRGEKRKLSPFVSGVVITSDTLLRPQSYSLPTLTNGCRCHYLNVFFDFYFCRFLLLLWVYLFFTPADPFAPLPEEVITLDTGKIFLSAIMFSDCRGEMMGLAYGNEVE